MNQKLNTGELFKLISQISICSSKNCSESKTKMMNDTEIFQKYMKANLEPDVKKKTELLNKIYKNKLVYEYNNCLFKHCSKLYVELINIIEKIINLKQLPKEKKDLLNKLIKEIKKDVKSPKISNEKINRILNNFNILQSLI